jgi:membrane associated rhomboid family serine protease
MSRNIFEEIKFQFGNGQAHVRLVAINIFVFILIQLLELICPSGLLNMLFTMPLEPSKVILSPWSPITSMFSHFDLMHILSNMLFLFFGGQLFLSFFSSKRLYAVYILGGLFGGFAEMIVRNIIEPNDLINVSVLGASGANMAIFVACAIYRPKAKVFLYGIIQVPIFIVALLLVLSDLNGIKSNDNIAHFAHLGGGLLGFLSAINLDSRYNIINFTLSKWNNFAMWRTSLFKVKTKLKAEKGGRPLTDEDYLELKKQKQDKINKILDKISKSGYESLSNEEKVFLFSQKND